MKTDLRNTKIDLSNYSENDRAKFQRFAFENGCECVIYGKKLTLLECPYIFIDGFREMTFETSINSKYFKDHDYRQIYFTDLFKEDSKDIVQQSAEKYQRLFDFFSNEHNLTLLEGELDEIIEEVNKFTKQDLRIKELEECLSNIINWYKLPRNEANESILFDRLEQAKQLLKD